MSDDVERQQDTAGVGIAERATDTTVALRVAAPRNARHVVAPAALEAATETAELSVSEIADAHARAEALVGRADGAPPAVAKKDKIYEAGGIIVLDDKVVLRFTDGGNWIFPKGKLKKHETPEDAAIREAVEETGLKVEIVGEAGEFRLIQRGKKRRFTFYFMRAVGKTWDWKHHEGRDTFLVPFERVASVLRREGYGELWEGVSEQVRDLLRPTAPLLPGAQDGSAPVG